MDFELVAANEGAVVIHDRVCGRLWRFIIVMHDDRRELSDTVTAGQDRQGDLASVGQYPHAWRFAYDAAVTHDLIDVYTDE